MSRIGASIIAMGIIARIGITASGQRIMRIGIITRSARWFGRDGCIGITMMEAIRGMTIGDKRGELRIQNGK
jgi:hypothetical protein